MSKRISTGNNYQFKLIESIIELKKEVNKKLNTCIIASIHNNIYSPTEPDIYYHMSKEDFIAKMFDLSLTHNITDIQYNVSDFSEFGNGTELELKIYVEPSCDYTSNITVDIMDAFYEFPIVPNQ